MKKLIFLFTIIVTLGVFNSTLIAQTNKPAPNDGGGGIDICPQGTFQTGVGFSCPFRNFHRPVNGCSHGFWFCFEPCTGYVICSDGSHVPFGLKTTPSLIGDTLTYIVEIIDNKIKLRFPIALKTAPGYTANDLLVMSADDEKVFILNNISYKNKIGVYTVNEINNELVILLNIKDEL